jgi:hypothetical protein
VCRGRRRSLAGAAMRLWAQSSHPIVSFFFGIRIFDVTADLLKSTFLLSPFLRDGKKGETWPIRPWTKAHSNYRLSV